MSELWAAVDRLTNPYNERVERDSGTHDWVRMPSLFDQLADAVQNGAGDAGRGKQSSRPPLDIACMSLLLEIAEAVRDACRGLEIKRSFDTPKDLRAVVGELHRQDDCADEQAWWVEQISRWCGRIRAAISSDPDRPWGLHDVACPECGAKRVTADDGGEVVRKPAIWVRWNKGYVRAVECLMCGAVWYRGADLETLVETMLTRHTPRAAEPA